MKKSASDSVCQLFDLQKEPVYQDFMCALRQGIVYFGRLFVLQNHICFYASFFAVKQKIVIKVDRIKNIQQSNGEVQIQEQTNLQTVKHSFSSFSNVRKAYSLMYSLWKGEPLPQEDSGSAEEQEKGDIEVNFYSTPLNLSKNSQILKVVLPFSPKKFFQCFLADKPEVYGMRDHFLRNQASNITISDWKPHQELGLTRQFKAQIKVKGVPFRNTSRMVAVHVLKWQGQNFTMHNMVKMLDVPFSSYFQVQKTWKVRLEEGKCQFEASAMIKWSKESYLKDTIQKKTIEDLVEDQKRWINTIKTKLRPSRSEFMGEFEQEKEFTVLQSQSDQRTGKEQKISWAHAQVLLTMVSLLVVVNLAVLLNIWIGRD